MSNLKEFCLGFFNEKGIEAYYNPTRSTITFPCFHCFQETYIDLENNTRWNCHFCNQGGNVKTLIDLSRVKKDLAKAKIYNPTKERNEINQTFKRLSQKHGYDIENLYKKVTNLIEFLDKENKKNAPIL